MTIASKIVLENFFSFFAKKQKEPSNIWIGLAMGVTQNLFHIHTAQRMIPSWKVRVNDNLFVSLTLQIAWQL